MDCPPPAWQAAPDGRLRGVVTSLKTGRSGSGQIILSHNSGVRNPWEYQEFKKVVSLWACPRLPEATNVAQCKPGLAVSYNCKRRINRLLAVPIHSKETALRRFIYVPKYSPISCISQQNKDKHLQMSPTRLSIKGITQNSFQAGNQR